MAIRKMAPMSVAIIPVLDELKYTTAKPKDRRRRLIIVLWGTRLIRNIEKSITTPPKVPTVLLWIFG